MNFHDDEQNESDDRFTGTLELDGRFSKGIASFNFRTHSQWRRNYFGEEGETRLYEGVVSLQPAAGVVMDFGKRALKWGKGYAWNPVGFIERPKDPNDPDLAREGYVMAVADIVRSFTSPLQAFAFTFVVMPVSENINEDFGRDKGVNIAAKAYFLYRDTDIDLMLLSGDTGSPRLGIDFSKNIASNFEIHAEMAGIYGIEKKAIGPDGSLAINEMDIFSYLLGFRYLTERETTFIVEYYHNGGGYTESQIKKLYKYVDTAMDVYKETGDESLLQTAITVSKAGLSRPNIMKNYLYARVSQKEPFDILYFTPSIFLIINLYDQSHTVTSELTYSGITNLELRARLTFVAGERLTEYGEKQNDNKAELRIRYYF